MLREAIGLLLAPASRHARRLGYAAEAIAIEARQRRCRSQWAPHIEQCHQSIRAAAALCAKRDLVVVLGSGPLFDIPLAELADGFSQVVLVDVFHSRAARRRAGGRPNLSLLEHDLLGLDRSDDLEQAAANLSAWRGLLGPPDLVISANLLTQLPLLPLDASTHGDDRQGSWAEAVMRAHLADLAGGPGVGCLISEWRRRWFDRAGAEIDRERPIDRLDLPAPQRSWNWTIAPPGELPRGESLILDVGAYRLGGRPSPAGK